MVRDTLYFPTVSFVNLYVTRWKGNESDRTTYGKRRDEYVV